MTIGLIRGLYLFIYPKTKVDEWGYIGYIYSFQLH